MRVQGKMLKKILWSLSFLLVIAQPLSARELEEYGPALNSLGLSGLFFTDSARIMPLGHLHLGGYTIYDEDDQTKLKFNQLNAAATLGILPNVEIGGYIPYINQTGGITGLGDAHASLKFLFEEQEDESVPALAISVTGILPTGYQGQGLRTVSNLGLESMLIGDTKINMPDYSFYLSAEWGLYMGKDINGITDRHFRYGGGAFLPITKRLVLMFEADGLAQTAKDSDFVRFSGSLKYVTRFLQVTAGIHKVSPLASGISTNTVGGQAAVSFTF